MTLCKWHTSSIKVLKELLVLGDILSLFGANEALSWLLLPELAWEILHVKTLLAQLRLLVSRDLDLLVFQGLNIVVLEPRVFEDLLQAALSTKALSWVFLEQLANEVSRIFRHIDVVLLFGREEHALGGNHGDQLLSVSLTVEEGRAANELLIDQNTECPPINCISVAIVLAVEHFWSHVLSGAAEGMGYFLWFNFLRDSEVSDGNVAVLVDNNVLHLQVPVDDVHRMQMSNCQSNLSSITLDSVFLEPFFSLKVSKQFTASVELHNEEDLDICCEAILHSYDEWVLGVLHHVLLKDRRFDDIVIDKKVLSD